MLPGFVIVAAAVGLAVTTTVAAALIRRAPVAGVIPQLGGSPFARHPGRSR